MKRGSAGLVILIIVGVLIILGIGGYFFYKNMQHNSIYVQNLHTEVNPSEYQGTPGIVKEIRENYAGGQFWYSVQITEYEDEATASSTVSKAIQQMNPSMIVMNKKYVLYLSQGNTSSTMSHTYAYQSGKNLISISSTQPSVDNVYSFTEWYQSKYPNTGRY